MRELAAAAVLAGFTAIDLFAATPCVSSRPDELTCHRLDLEAREATEVDASDPCAALPRRLPAAEQYAHLGDIHRLLGNASYYSAFFHGRKTANGEIFRNDRFSAAHLTLPLGSWVEIRSRATGRKLRLRVNDRGPYKGNFVIDLSRAAARELGVDVAYDRHVDVRVIALPGEDPPPENEEIFAEESGAEETIAAATE